MAIQRVQRLRHLLAAANAFIGLQGELTIVIDTNEIRSHDGSTAGGRQILTKIQNDALYQALNTDLSALSAFGSGTTGLISRIANGQYALRTLVGPAAGITVTNAGGVAGNITLALANDLLGLESLGTTGLATRTADGTWTTRAIGSSTAALTVTNGDGVAGAPTLALAGDLASIAGFGVGVGIVAHTASNTFTLRTIASSSNNLVITNGDGVAGAPSFAFALDLSVLSGFAAGTGISSRTAANTWSLRTVTGTANEITLANGDGVGGNPTVSLPAALTFTGKTVTGGTFAATAVSVGGTAVVVNTRQIIAGTGLSGGGDLSADRTLSLPNVGPGAGAIETSKITLDAQGRVTAAVIRNTATFRDQKGPGVNGDALTAQTWTKRTLAKVIDTGSIFTISSNVITVSVTGTYDIHALFTAANTGGSSAFQTRLRNTTDSTTTTLSNVAQATGASIQCTMAIHDRITLTTGKNYEFQTFGDNGANGIAGLATSAGSPVENAQYAQVHLSQVA